MEPQQKYRLETVSIKILGGLNRFYGIPTSPSASVMAQNIQLFGPREGFLTHQWIIWQTSFDNASNVTSVVIVAFFRFVTLASCISRPTETECGRDAKQKISTKPNNLIPNYSFRSKKMHTHLMSLFTNKDVTIIWSSEVKQRSYKGNLSKKRRSSKSLYFSLVK